jgi:hypothetical protein
MWPEYNDGFGVTRRHAGCLIVTAEDPKKAEGFAAAPKTTGKCLTWAAATILRAVGKLPAKQSAVKCEG